MNKYTLLRCILLFFSVCALSYYLIATKQTERQTLVLGTMSGWPPYVSINAQGEYEGFDIEIAQEIARRLNKQLVIQDMDTVALIAALEQRKVDFIMTGLDITFERLARIAMIPYEGEQTVSQPLVFWQQFPADITNFEDVLKKGITIAVEPGSSQESFLLQFQNRITIKGLEPSIALLELQQGRVDAILLQQNLFEYFRQTYPQLIAFEVALDDQHKTFGNGIGVKKDNVKLITIIEQIIKDLKQNGTFAQWHERWITKK